MPHISVIFHEIVQGEQVLDPANPNRSFLRSEIKLTILNGPETFENLIAEISQPHGTPYQTSAPSENEPLEVGRPQGYRGPFDHGIFRDHVERLYRHAFGNTASGIRIEGAASVTMSGNRFGLGNLKVQIPVSDPNARSW